MPLRLRPVAAAAAFALFATSALGQPMEIQGVVTARQGSQVVVTQAGGGTVTMTITPSTRAVESSGSLLKSKADRDVATIIKGLPVTVEANRTGETVEALKFTYKDRDYRTAVQVQAGTAELQAQNDELRNRLASANEYVLKDEASVFFATGSAALTSESKATLRRIAEKAKTIDGYAVGIVGYADPRGSPEANQRLSARRALAVTAYVQQCCAIMPSRVLAPDAMGEAVIIGDASTTEGLAQNRRVTVKVLVNKGLDGLTPVSTGPD